MRIIRPEDFRRLPKKRKLRRLAVIASIVLVVSGGAGWWWLRGANQRAAVQAWQTEGSLKHFSDEEFRALAGRLANPNTRPPQDVAISTNPVADQQMRTLAQELGYRPSHVAMGELTKLGLPDLDGDDRLQAPAAQAWRELETAAHRDEVPLIMISAHRSIEYQRDVFMKRLLARGVTLEEVAAGRRNDEVRSTLKLTPLPGYSRHHTGYAVDLWCRDGSNSFAKSSCYHWLRADNFAQAKRAGWIPSYAGYDLAQSEPGEFVWVGQDNVTN